MQQDHINWCRNLFRTLKDGGAWAVPRSGLIFRREGESLRLIAADARVCSPAAQDSDLAAIKEHFKAAGIEVR